ncbi:MAG: 30S ribosomal protein S20 [Clostridiales bacterium]|nr:30S ribosomal protein S20 [Clostridiales bacterium]
MPNIKSAKKRVLVTDKKNGLNRSTKSEIATAKKKFLLAVENKQVEEASKLFREVVSLLDAAARENVISKNCASRNQANLAKKLASLNA